MTSPSIASLIIKKESTTSSPPPPLPCDLHTQTPPFTSHHEWKQPQALTRNRCRPHASFIAHRTVSQINLFFLINYPAPGVLPQQHKQTRHSHFLGAINCYKKELLNCAYMWTQQFYLQEFSLKTINVHRDTATHYEHDLIHNRVNLGTTQIFINWELIIKIIIKWNTKQP